MSILSNLWHFAQHDPILAAKIHAASGVVAAVHYLLVYTLIIPVRLTPGRLLRMLLIATALGVLNAIIILVLLPIEISIHVRRSSPWAEPRVTPRGPTRAAGASISHDHRAAEFEVASELPPSRGDAKADVPLLPGRQ